MDNFLPAKVVKHKPLTKKHLEIIMLVSQGMPKEKVAEKLGIAVSTITNLFKREDVRDARRQMIEDMLDEGYGKAIHKIIEQIDSDNDWVAQNAARVIIQTVNSKREEEKAPQVVFQFMDSPSMPEESIAVEGEGDVS